MAKVTGIVKVAVNGTIQRSEIGAELDFGGMERTPAVGYKLYGFSEKLVPAHLKYTLFHMSDTDLLALKDIVGGTARFECDSGPIYPLTNATTVKTLRLKGGDGKVDVEMDCDPVDTKQ
jgi:hypothetical protein